MSDYCYVAEVFTPSESIRVVKVTDTIINEGDAVRLTDGTFGEVIAVEYMKEDSPAYRIIDHIKPIENYQSIYGHRHTREENTDAHP